jgi:hypothetical protein
MFIPPSLSPFALLDGGLIPRTYKELKKRTPEK